MAMNEDSSVFAAAMLQRFWVNVWGEQDCSEDGPNMLATNARTHDPAVKKAFEAMKLFWRRNQMLLCEIQLRIATGVMVDVNFKACGLFFGMVGAHMKATNHINMSDNRKFERFKAIVRVLVIMDAIDLVWDSALSPIKEVPHMLTHLLLVEKHLVATKEHAIFAIGLLSNQWEDTLRIDVVATMKKLFFPNCQGKIDALSEPVAAEIAEVDVPMPDLELPPGKYIPAMFKKNRSAKDKAMDDDPDVRAAKEAKAVYDGDLDRRRNWMYDTCMMGSHTIPMPPSGFGGKPAPVGDVVTAIANQLIKHLKSRPLKSEVEAVLYGLMRDTSDETRTIYHDGNKAITTQEPVRGVSALQIEGDRIRMSLRVLDTACRPDVLYQSVKAVADMLEDETSGGTTFLYGDPELELKWIWRTIEAKKASEEELAANPELAKLEKSLRRIWSADFADDVMRNMVLSFLRSIQPDTPDAFMKELFQSNTPWINVDMDIDLDAIQVHSRELGLNKAAREAQPSNNPRTTDDILREHFEARLVYPKDIPSRDKQAVKDKWNKLERRRPQDFSMRSRYDKAIEQDEAFEAPEPVVLDYAPPLEGIPGFIPPPSSARRESSEGSLAPYSEDEAMVYENVEEMPNEQDQPGMED